MKNQKTPRSDRLKQAFDHDLRLAVEAYHDYHGDHNVRLVRFVCDPLGNPQILTRSTDNTGRKVSCLLNFFWNGRVWDISENESCLREDEHCMLFAIVTGKDDQAIMDAQAMDDDDIDETLRFQQESREESRELSRLNAQRDLANKK